MYQPELMTDHEKEVIISVMYFLKEFKLISEEEK